MKYLSKTKTLVKIMVTAKSLLECGYFPKEISPPFNSRKFADIIPHLSLNHLDQMVEDWRKEDYGKNKPESKCCTYSIPRFQNIRRNISIPNPLYHTILCHHIEKNWSNIAAFIKKSPISLSRPCIPIKNEKSNRSFDKISDYLDSNQEIAIKSSSFRVMLKVDIARYYNTIYTHSIPWALHEKSKAKKNRQASTLRHPATLYGNDIDKWLRSTREGQTLGIPVGPDTSQIISEIIGTAIESELVNEGVELNGIRFIDDFILFFRDKNEAQIALAKLHDVLNRYELEINPHKTFIEELPYILEPEWKSALRQYHFRKLSNQKQYVVAQKTDVINYFSRTFEYCNQFPDKNILLYSIKKIQNEKILKENWALTESLILKTMILNGSCIPIALQIIYDYKLKGYTIDDDKIQQVITEIIRYNSQYGNNYEISWALWLSKVFDLEVKKEVISLVEKNDNPIVVLTALDLREAGLIEKNIDVSHWESFMNKNQLYDDHWLLAYEANVKGWLSGSRLNYLEEDPFYKILKDNNVEFYDTNAIPNSGSAIDTHTTFSENF